MPKTVPAALEASLAASTQTLASALKFVRKDGVTVAMTDAQFDVQLDFGDGRGTVTAKRIDAFTRTAIDSKASLAVDNFDIDIVLDVGDITTADVRGGKYDAADAYACAFDWTNPGTGVIKVRRGRVGNVVLKKPGLATVEIRGMNQALTQSVVELISAQCRADLGDARCKVQLTPPIWQPNTFFALRSPHDEGLAATGHPNVVAPSVYNDRHFVCVQAGFSGATEAAWNTAIGGATVDGGVVWQTRQAFTVLGAVVSSVTDNRTFTVTVATAASAALLTGGLAIWTGGNNAGLSREIKSWAPGGGGGTVTLFLLMELAVQVGDTLSLQAGCDKLLATCANTFDNTYNRRAEDLVPGQDLLMTVPNAI